MRPRPRLDVEAEAATAQRGAQCLFDAALAPEAGEDEAWADALGTNGLE
jgi:hypothetical protein